MNKIVKVYHTKERDFKQAEKFNPDNFTPVAGVDIPVGLDAECALERAYMKTNSIEEVWWMNQGVFPIVTETRSTSIGDVLELDGKFYAVAMFGFVEIQEGK